MKRNTICDHCNNKQEDCDERTKLWREENKLVVCLTHLSKFNNIKHVHEMTKNITCGLLGCNEDGIYLLETNKK